MNYTNLSKEEMKQEIISNVKSIYRKKIEDATPEEIYQAAVFAVKDIITDKWIKTHDEYKKKDVKVVLSFYGIFDGTFFRKRCHEFNDV